MKPVVSTSPLRWVQLGTYTGCTLLLTLVLSRGVSLRGHFIHVDPSDRETLRALLATAWAPFAWNVFPRLEFRYRLLSRLTFGDRGAAHLLFALYIVAFSALRERLFFAAIAATPAWTTAGAALDAALRAIGGALLALGALLSAAGFYHLRVRFTYMGEYFGFRMHALVTNFPFSVCPDPMYNGSTFMHFGYALRALSPAGFYLAVVTGLSYWIAAKIFEEPFMTYCYSGQADKEA